MRGHHEATGRWGNQRSRRPQLGKWLLFAILGSLLAGQTVPVAWAQPPAADESTPATQPDDPATDEGQPPATSSPATEPAAQPKPQPDPIPMPIDPTEPVPADPATAAEAPTDRLIFIPFDKLNSVFDRLKSKVVLSYAEYLDLLRKAGQGEGVEPGKKPAVISSARYDATVRGDVVEVRVVYNCQVVQPAWGEIPVQFGGAAVGDLKTNGGMQVLLRGTGPGQYSLLFEKAGQVEVTLTLLVAIKRAPSGPSIELTVPPVGITTFSLTVPQAEQEITVSPRNIPIPGGEAPPEQTSRTTVSLGATDKIGVTWVPKVSERPQMDLLTTVTNTQAFSIRDGLVHTTAKLHYRILRGELTQLRVAVPLEHRILDVTSSARMQGWTVTRDEQRQVVEVVLLGGAEESLTLDLHTEQPLTGETLALGGLTEDGTARGVHALDVTREQGELTVGHGDELTLAVSEQSGLMRIETAAGAANTLAFRFFSPRFVLMVRAEPVQPLIDVSHEAMIVVREQRVETDTRLNYTIRRAGVFSLKVKLPADWTLQGVECPQMAEFQHDQPNGILTVVLREKTQSGVTVRVRGFLTAETKPRETRTLDNLPLLEPLAVRQEEGRIAVFTTEAIELVTQDDKIVSAQPIPTQQIGATFPDATIRAAWKFQSRPVVIPVRTLRRPTRLTAETASVIKVDPAGVQVEATVTYQVQYAGVDQFRIAVPARVADRVQIEIVGPGDTPILQKTRETDPAAEQDAALETAEAAAGPGAEKSKKAIEVLPLDAEPVVIWVIQTQRPVTGRQRFRITYDLPIVRAAEGADAATLNAAVVETVQPVWPVGLERDRDEPLKLTRSAGEVAVLVDPATALSVVAAGDGLEAIDPRELTLLPQAGQQAYRYRFQSPGDPIRLQLTSRRFETEAVVSTVVSRMLTEYVLGVSREVAVRARMRVKSSERQRLQLQLPAGVQPMQVLVNNELRQLQKGDPAADAGWTNFFINVSRGGDAETEFWLTVQYLQTGDPLPQRSPRGSLVLPQPRLLTAGEQPAVVQQARCVVWLPDPFVPVSVNKPFTRVTDLRPISFRRGVTGDPEQERNTQTWLGADPGSGLDFPADGEPHVFQAIGSVEAIELTYWNRNIVLSALTVALLLIGLILMGTTLENKIMVVIIAVTLLTIALQFEPEMVSQGVHASRFGIVALLAIWLVHGVVRCRNVCFATPEGGSGSISSAARTDSPARREGKTSSGSGPESGNVLDDKPEPPLPF